MPMFEKSPIFFFLLCDIVHPFMAYVAKSIDFGVRQSSLFLSLLFTYCMISSKLVNVVKCQVFSSIKWES